MKIGLILLSSDGCYVDDRRQLPYRPSWDKELLTAFVRCNTVSEKGYALLPPSIQQLTSITLGIPTMAITIPELDSLPNILLVTRSPRKVRNGKPFRLDNYRKIAESFQLEIYIRKEEK